MTQSDGGTNIDDGTVSLPSNVAVKKGTVACMLIYMYCIMCSVQLHTLILCMYIIHVIIIFLLLDLNFFLIGAIVGVASFILQDL